MPFKKGQSGNPGGRAKKTAFVFEIEALAKTYAPTALKTLADIAARGKTETARVSAAIALLDRGFGRPLQSVSMDARTINQNYAIGDTPPSNEEWATEHVTTH